MRLEGAARLKRKLKKLPANVRAEVRPVVARQTQQGARVARILAPDLSGETRQKITPRFADEGMVGIVEAIDPQAPRAEKDRQYAIEHGRKKGQRGTTEGKKFMRQTRSYMAKKANAAIKRAISKAIKKAAQHGG